MSDITTFKLPVAPKGRPTYRAYHLKHDGSIDSATIIQAASDDEAKTSAAKMVNGHGIELWERGRLLGSYPPLSASE